LFEVYKYFVKLTMSSHWNEFRLLDKEPSKKRQRVSEDVGSSSVSTFSLRSLPSIEHITEESMPELLNDSSESSTLELSLAETRFFNQHNSDYWERNNLNHLHPYDFPYVRQQIQAPITKTLSPEDVRHKNESRAVIEVVTRAYEDDFLREAVGNERACTMNDQCQGLFLPHIKDQAFILREFLLPSEQESFKRTGKYSSEGRLCLMCKRSEIARAFFNIRADGMGIKDHVILQDYRNIVGKEGEYCLEDCIVSGPNVFQGLLDPIVLHIKTAYRLKVKNGVRYYDQWRMKYPNEKDPFFRDPLEIKS